MSFGDYNYSRTDDGNSFQDSQNDFLRKSKTITKNIEKISKNTAEARQLVNNIGTNNDNQNVRNGWNNIRQETSTLVQDTFALVRGLSALPPSANQTERKQRKIQKERLTDQLTQSLNAFQALQREAAGKEKQSFQRARTSFSNVDEGSFEDYNSGQQRQVQGLTDMEQDVDLMILEERGEAIKQLEEDISNVNLTFQELGRLVHEQTDTITSIEDMVEDAVVQVETGKKELEEAVTHVTAARKKKLICVIILVIVIIIIATILGVYIPKGKS